MRQGVMWQISGDWRDSGLQCPSAQLSNLAHTWLPGETLGQRSVTERRFQGQVKGSSLTTRLGCEVQLKKWVKGQVDVDQVKRSRRFCSLTPKSNWTLSEPTLQAGFLPPLGGAPHCLTSDLWPLEAHFNTILHSFLSIWQQTKCSGENDFVCLKSEEPESVTTEVEGFELGDGPPREQRSG